MREFVADQPVRCRACGATVETRQSSCSACGERLAPMMDEDVPPAESGTAAPADTAAGEMREPLIDTPVHATKTGVFIAWMFLGLVSGFVAVVAFVLSSMGSGGPGTGHTVFWTLLVPVAVSAVAAVTSGVRGLLAVFAGLAVPTLLLGSCIGLFP
jgi:hypothetical protein